MSIFTKDFKISRLKTYGTFALVALVLFVLFQKDLVKHGLLKLIQKHPYVQELTVSNRKLHKALRTKVTVKQGKVIIRYRDREVVKEIKIEKPPEGKVEVLDSKDGDAPRGIIDRITTDDYKIPNSSMTVRVTVGGLTFSPAISMRLPATDKLGANLDLRFIYWRRWGVVGMLAPVSGLAIDRRIDDVIPFFKNTTIGLYYGYDHFKANKQIGIRVGVFL